MANRSADQSTAFCSCLCSNVRTLNLGAQREFSLFRDSLEAIEKYAPLLEPTLFNGVPTFIKNFYIVLSTGPHYSFQAPNTKPKCVDFAVVPMRSQNIRGRLRMIASGGAGLSDDTLLGFLKDWLADPSGVRLDRNIASGLFQSLCSRLL